LASDCELDISAIDEQLPSSLADIANAPVDDVKRGLDVLLLYLRRVHFFCYYCGKGPADSVETLVRRCGSRHVRRLLPEGGVTG
jgi:hypothetical protein